MQVTLIKHGSGYRTTDGQFIVTPTGKGKARGFIVLEHNKGKPYTVANLNAARAVIHQVRNLGVMEKIALAVVAKVMEQGVSGTFDAKAANA